MPDDFELGYDSESRTWMVRIVKPGESVQKYLNTDWIQKYLRTPSEVADFILSRIGTISNARETSRARKHWIEQARRVRRDIRRDDSGMRQLNRELQEFDVSEKQMKTKDNVENNGRT